MNILLCEGKNDAWFFDELMKVRFDDRMYTIDNDNLKKLQEMCGDCYQYINRKYPLIIYGDGGKNGIQKILKRIIIETLSRNNYIIMIRDDDNTPYEDLERKLLEELESIIRDTSKFTTRLPDLESKDNLYILKHPKSEGSLKVSLSTVPISLEKQIVKKTVALKCPSKSDILEKESHEALELLASEYYGGDREKLIRESSTWLRDETWVDNINRSVDLT